MKKRKLDLVDYATAAIIIIFAVYIGYQLLFT